MMRLPAIAAAACLGGSVVVDAGGLLGSASYCFAKAEPPERAEPCGTASIPGSDCGRLGFARSVVDLNHGTPHHIALVVMRSTGSRLPGRYSRFSLIDYGFSPRWWAGVPTRAPW